jgi:hypothetical protein
MICLQNKMKKNNHLSVEQLWDNLLSREIEKIKSSFQHLNQSDRIAVIEHLNRMTTEDGWHPEQNKSAQIALQAIEEFTKGNKK